ncbi:MAG TPA: acyltransferase [Chloroflexota bacterium]|nr:acyltransferase [Chloroflexota bacterium]
MTARSVHPTALVESAMIGDGTTIWAYCHVLAGAVIGRNCNLGDHCYVEAQATIGDDVVLKNGVSVWSGVAIENRVFVGPNVAFTNDRAPRAKVFNSTVVPTLIREGASLGANATILCGIIVGRYAMVGAGAVVTRDVPDFGLALGNPARVVGHVCQCARRLTFLAGVASCDCGRSYRQDQSRVEVTT